MRSDGKAEPKSLRRKMEPEALRHLVDAALTAELRGGVVDRQLQRDLVARCKEAAESRHGRGRGL